MAELKPCPFCGSDNTLVAQVGAYPRSARYAVVCDDCKSIGGQLNTPEEAIEAWNRRAVNG